MDPRDRLGYGSSMAEGNTPLLVGLGEILWDLLPAGKQLGGAPANFAYHAAALGGRGAVVSRVGRDALGDEILRRLDAMGLDRSCVSVDSAHPTGTVTVDLDRNGVPTYVIHSDVASDFVMADEIVLDLVRRADGVCFGTLAQRSPPSREAIRAFLGATRTGCLRVFDINLRRQYDANILHDLMKVSDVLTLNDEELPVVAKLLELPEGVELEELLRRFPLRVIAVTRGRRGSVLLDRTTRVEHTGYEAGVRDTVGAGDAFTAAVALGLLRGLPLQRISDAANRVASYVCSQAGATPPLPEELRTIVA